MLVIGRQFGREDECGAEPIADVAGGETRLPAREGLPGCGRTHERGEGEISTRSAPDTHVRGFQLEGEPDASNVVSC